MFARATRLCSQPDQYKQWQSNVKTLRLPWLCPVLCGVASRPRKRSTIAGFRSTRKLSLPRPSPFQRADLNLSLKPRGLASAAHAVSTTPQEDFIPWEMSQGPYQPPKMYPYPLSNQNSLAMLRGLSPDSALVINDARTNRRPHFRAFDGISGDVTEIMQTILACIEVDRLERAASLMRRLNLLYKPDAPDLLEAHNDYLKGLLQSYGRTKDLRTFVGIHKWFQKDIIKAGVVPDASTYALMIIATRQDTTAKNMNRTTNRYIVLAKDAGIWEDTCSIMRILSGEKILEDITQIAPADIDETDQGQSQDPAKTVVVSESVDSSPDEALRLPPVKETKQKGYGLTSLRSSLSMFSEPSSITLPKKDDGMDGERRRMHLLERQKRLEIDAFNAAVARWRSENENLKKFGINTALNQRSIGATLWNWHEKFTPWIEEEILKVDKAEGNVKKSPADKDRCLYGPFLRLLPAHKLSAITIMVCISFLTNAVDHRGVPLSKLVLSVGTTIEDEIAAEKIKIGSEISGPNVDLAHRFQRLLMHIKNQNSRRSIAKLLASSGLSENHEHVCWTSSIKARIGAVLISSLVEIAKIDVHLTNPETGIEHRESQPGFVHGYVVSKGRRLGVLRFNRALIEKLSKEHLGAALPRFLPMIVEPRPWTSFKTGAFLAHRHKAVRIKDDYESTRYAITASRNGDMKQIFAGLDVLGMTPWRINRGLLKVMLHAWESGKPFGKIPVEHAEFDYPREPDMAEGIAHRRKWLKEIKAIENKKAGLKSQRCFYNFQLEIARAYANETLYFPHSVDFRGRAYPMVPLFNHMGADPCRSLLVFAKGKELGEGGLRWLKIHLASLYGFDKASLEERRQFTDDHISDILDSATNPLSGKRWWLQAEDPWQCLGACMELKNALDQPDPCRFVSHLPIHQDGTCNGLQHYAALGGDVAGAKQVNLEPGDRPSDIYTAVAEIVKAELVKLATQGNELARLLDGKVTRKVVKQTVMTNVYGVTWIGALRQVRGQLESILPADFPKTKTLNFQKAAKLVTNLTFGALSSMFQRAHEIQRWFGDCAAIISQAVSPQQMKRLHDEADGKVDSSSQYSNRRLLKKKPAREGDLFRTSLIWTTPLKMPVVQPYRKSTMQTVNTHLQRFNLARSSTSSDPVSKAQQCRAFPPNFIHSLDATHMILTALKCNEVGLSFAAVHDSFWTHACDLDTMNRIIRDAFIKMHSENVMGRLRAEFNARYKGYMHLATVDASSAVAQNIAQWRKKDRKTSFDRGIVGANRKVQELLMESRRLKLIASDNPEERMEGESMITAGQIFENMANEKDLIPAETIYSLGQLPASKAKNRGGVRHPDIEEPLKPLSSDAACDTVITERLDKGLEYVEDGKIGGNEKLAGDLENKIDQECKEDDTNDSSENIQGKAENSAKRKSRRDCWVWLPAAFPPIPEKGDFEVSKLKDSQYFFS